tara:strand:- start:1732 stop:1929 length:198 start_codon:yes stop_codon:yes gene_type:complete
MSFLIHLKRANIRSDIRWIVKYHNSRIKEVKQIFNPDEYKSNKNAKIMYNRKELIKILENDKETK